VETITSDAKDGKFTWTPDSNVAGGTPYAFQIMQGSQSNYSGQMKALAGKAVTSDQTTAATQATQATTGTGVTTAPTTEGTKTGATTGQTTSTGSKALISSSASGTRSSSAAPTSMVTDSVMGSSSATGHHKAKQTGGVQNGASRLQYSAVVGALAVLAFFFQ
jgi:hypothetical protein